MFLGKIVMLRVEKYLDEVKRKQEISNLFLEAFPEDERPPLDIFLESLKKKKITLLTFYDEDKFIGFAYLAFHKDICCIFFLAVSSNYRHQGYGGQILEIIKRDYKDYVLMLGYEEVDPKYDNYEERVIRENFYRSHGFIDNKLKTNEYGVIYETAYIGSHLVSFEQYFEIFKLVFGPNHEGFVKDATR